MMQKVSGIHSVKNLKDIPKLGEQFALDVKCRKYAQVRPAEDKRIIRDPRADDE